MSFLEVSWTNLKSHKSRLNCSLLCPCSCGGIGCNFCNFNFSKQTRQLIQQMISMVLLVSTTQVIYYLPFGFCFIGGGISAFTYNTYYCIILTDRSNTDILHKGDEVMRMRREMHSDWSDKLIEVMMVIQVSAKLMQKYFISFRSKVIMMIVWC